MEMTAPMWSAVIGAIVVLLTLGGFVWRLASRLATAETKTEQIEKELGETHCKYDDLAKSFSDHKEQLAKEYVSYPRFTDLKSDVLLAINNLGDRIDRLFSTRMGGATA